MRFFRNSPDHLKDEELLERYRSTNKMTYLGILFNRYMEAVYGICLKYLKNEAAAEDAVMNIFEELTVKTKKHDIQKFKSWLFILSKNHCLMKLRKEKKMTTVSFEPEFMQSEAIEHPTYGETPMDETALLNDCVEQLPVLQKECIDLFYFKEQSYKEIAEKTGYTLGKVRSNIQNGRRNLKICLEGKDWNAE